MSQTGRNPVPPVVTECQYLLFAATVFVGCMLTDVQSAPAALLRDHVAQMFARWTGHESAHAAAAPQRPEPARAARPAP